jgi:hypothetical protein
MGGGITGWLTGKLIGEKERNGERVTLCFEGPDRHTRLEAWVWWSDK